MKEFLIGMAGLSILTATMFGCIAWLTINIDEADLQKLEHASHSVALFLFGLVCLYVLGLLTYASFFAKKDSEDNTKIEVVDKS